MQPPSRVRTRVTCESSLTRDVGEDGARVRVREEGGRVWAMGRYGMRGGEGGYERREGGCGRWGGEGEREKSFQGYGRKGGREGEGTGGSGREEVGWVWEGGRGEGMGGEEGRQGI